MPLLIFDGECGFCRRWVGRWKNATGEAVTYLPLQDPAVATQFPEIPREDMEESIHLVLPDGSVYYGAEAVFRSLAAGGRERWLLRLYEKFPPFADASELLYEEVALHRTAFSKLDRIYFGEGPDGTGGIWVRFLFLRGLGLVYLIAFLSLWAQIQGLVGSEGIVPASQLMAAVKTETAQRHMGLERFHIFPTLAWWSASDRALNWQCGVGTACAVALLAGLAPAPMLFLLWAIYLSLCTICGPFLDFQWDTLLLETGLVAIFYAPLQWRERPSRQRKPPTLMLWLLRWLLFRLMFESGSLKLLSGDESWWNLSALFVHYETQPLPTWIGWYAHQMPARFQEASVLIMLLIEIIVPVFIFCGRRFRLLAAALLAWLQLLILLTGNYAFFNYLTLLLCLTLLDDRVLGIFRKRRDVEKATAPPNRGARWPWPVMLGLTVVITIATLIPFFSSLGVAEHWPAPVISIYTWLKPLRSFNGYGLFRVMTQTRPEIIIEGSDDGRDWKAYRFKDKAGELDGRPKFVAPHQPRLDWQMWFAALEDPQENPWFLRFELRLLENSPSVLALLEENPFPKGPPKYVRATLYEYHFTDRATRRATGDWWRRKFLRVYVPALSLEDFGGG